MTEPDPYVDAVRKKAARMAKARAEKRSLWAALARAGSVGWQIALPLLVGAFGGSALARHLGLPWITLVGLALGLGVGLIASWSALSRSLEEVE